MLKTGSVRVFQGLTGNPTVRVSSLLPLRVSKKCRQKIRKVEDAKAKLASRAPFIRIGRYSCGF